MQLRKVVNHNNTRWRVSVYVEGKRRQRFFSSKKLALKWMSQLRLSLHSGEFWSRLSLEEQRDIIHAYSFAKSKGQLLSRCLTTPSESPKRLSSSLSKAIDGYQSVLQQKSLRPASLEQTRRFLGQLADLFGNEQAHLVSASHLENWFESRNWKRSTIDGVIAKVEPFFSWLVRENLIDANPCESLRKPISEENNPPKILSPSQAHSLLFTALKLDPPTARYFAIGLFAGVRPHEIGRLSREDISSRYIEISAPKAKTRKRRLITVLPNLGKWLLVSEFLPVKNKRRRLEKVISNAGLRWSHDVMRHSFASYHLAQFRSAEKRQLFNCSLNIQ